MDKTFSYEEFLDQNGELTYTNMGVSMLPLLRQGKDLFTVRKKEKERLRVGDVALYRRPPNQYVLHRVIEVREKDYVILGDNCVKKEYGITDEDILAVMTGYVRGGKKHTTREKGYRIYTWIILHTIPVRIFCKKAVLRLKRAAKKVLGK